MDDVIKTSERGWLSKLSVAYRDHRRVIIIDDANIGIDPANQTIFSMGKHPSITFEEWVAVGISLGISSIGIWMIYLATKDPEPTTKLGLIIGGGSVCIMFGGFTAIHILTKNKPPSVKITNGGFEIDWI